MLDDRTLWICLSSSIVHTFTYSSTSINFHLKLSNLAPSADRNFVSQQCVELRRIRKKFYENHSRSRSCNLRFYRAQNKNIFTARGYGEFKGGWKFSGGKFEAGETAQQAVVREIKEELDATVKVGDLIDTIEYDYPAFHSSMDCFWCEIASGELKLLEAEAARWLTKEELDSVQWFPADVNID